MHVWRWLQVQIDYDSSGPSHDFRANRKNMESLIESKSRHSFNY